MLEKFFDLPEWVQKFIAGFLAGLAIVAAIVACIAPIALAIMFETAAWFWAYAILFPAAIGIGFAFDFF